MIRLLPNFEGFSLDSVPEWERIAGSVLVLLIGLLFLRIGTRMFMRTFGRGLRDQSRELIRKTILYIGGMILFVIVLNAAGVSVGALLGAAGVVGIAVGIASQASLSNIISGLFLVSERFFEIGDVVRIREHVGIVQSIDLLSIKVKTFDNLLIRVPNQQLIEQDLVNITRYPIRRMDVIITIPAYFPADRTLEALRAVATGIPEVLEEPEPLVLAGDFVEDGLTVRIGVWFEREQFVTVRNALFCKIQTVFRERNIPIRTRTIQIENNHTPRDGVHTV